MASRLHRNLTYLHRHPRFIHPNSFLYNAYYQRTIHRRFASKINAMPGHDKPNHIVRILFVNSILVGSIIYWNEWTDDIIAFTKQRFAYLQVFTKDKKKTLASVYKLPRPKPKEQIPSVQSSSVYKKPKPKPKPKPTPKPMVIAKPTPVPPTIPKPSTPKLEPEPEPEPKPKAKPEPTVIAKPVVIAKPSLPEPKTSLPILVTEEPKETKETSELIEKYETIKDEVFDIALEKDTQDKDDGTVKIEIEVESESESERENNENNKKEIMRLNKLIDEKLDTIEELERDLAEKSEFLTENLQKLEEGRKSYDEMVSIFEEMRVEYGEQMIQQMEHMENERKTRLDKLAQFSIDIRVLEKVLGWYDVNNKFFLSLSELNNTIYTFEEKINKGLSYENELNYLLKNIPQSFISYQLLTNLNQLQNKWKTFHIHSHRQLYDRFCIVETALRETAMTPKSTNSLWGNLFAKIFSFLLIKEQISRSGTSLNDRISRAGYSMKLGDLDSALNELNYLDEDVLYPAQDWLRSARQRLLGLSLLKMLKSELLSRSVKMVDNE